MCSERYLLFVQNKIRIKCWVSILSFSILFHLDFELFQILCSLRVIINVTDRKYNLLLQ